VNALDDEKLMKLLRSREDEALIYIIERYSKLLWVVVCGVLNNIGTSEDIEECISDAYMTLWHSPKSFNPQKGSLKTFLAIVAKRKALDKYRQLTKANIIELNEAISSSDDDLFEYIVRQDLYSELYEAIRLLREPDKEILIRRYFFDEKPSGIAEKTHIPVKDVKNRLYQSKQQLRKTLQHKGGYHCE
jgi:RNA polymerase sigma-70 factor (ECF subfamily)